MYCKHLNVLQALLECIASGRTNTCTLMTNCESCFPSCSSLNTRPRGLRLQGAADRYTSPERGEPLPCLQERDFLVIFMFIIFLKFVTGTGVCLWGAQAFDASLLCGLAGLCWVVVCRTFCTCKSTTAGVAWIPNRCHFEQSHAFWM